MNDFEKLKKIIGFVEPGELWIDKVTAAIYRRYPEEDILLKSKYDGAMVTTYLIILKQNGFETLEHYVNFEDGYAGRLVNFIETIHLYRKLELLQQ